MDLPSIMDLSSIFHFHLPTVADTAHLTWWEHFGTLVERYDQDFLENYPNLWGFIKAFWKVIFVVLGTIVVLFSNPVRIASFLFSNSVAVLNMFLRRQALQQLVNEEKIYMAARVRTAAEFDAASSQRGQRLKAYRDAIAGQRIGLEGPYAVTLLIEIVFFNQDFLHLRSKLKDALRKWDEIEEHIREATYKLSLELDIVKKPFEADLYCLLKKLDEADVLHSNALAELRGRLTLFGYFGLKPAEVRAKWRVIKARRAFLRKKKEVQRHCLPHERRCDAHLRTPLIELDSIERNEVIPLVERFLSDWRSIVTTVQIGRTVRKLMDKSDESTKARKALVLESLPDTRDELFKYIHDKLDGKISFSPISPVEEWLEPFLRQHLLANLETIDKIGTDVSIEKAWLEGLCPPASKGLVLGQFPFHRPHAA